MSTLVIPLRDLLKAPSLPKSPSTESSAALSSWFRERGNTIVPLVVGANTDFSLDVNATSTADFENPDQTPGLTIKIADSKTLHALLDSARNSVPLVQPGTSSFLRRFARNLEKSQGLLGLSVSCDSKRSVVECRKHDVPLAIQTAHHFAGLSRPLVDSKDLSAKRTVSCIVPSVEFPLLDVVRHICPAVLMDQAVMILATPATCRTMGVIMDLIQQSGYPSGIVSFAPIMQFPDILTDFDYLHCCLAQDSSSVLGSLNEYLQTRKSVKLPPKLFYPRKSFSSAIITDGADLDSAVFSVLELGVFAGGFCRPNVLVQETVIENIITALKARMSVWECGSHLDKSADYSSVVGQKEAEINKDVINSARQQGVEIVGLSNTDETTQTLSCPLLIATTIAPAASLFHDKYNGPLISVMPFRTLKEAVALANNGHFGQTCSIWSENTSAAMELARNVRAATIWINGCSLFDAAVGSGGSLNSGWPVVGNGALVRQVLFDFLRFPLPTQSPDPNTKSPEASKDSTSTVVMTSKIEKTLNMFYGGQQKRAESGLLIPVNIQTKDGGLRVVEIADGGAKDLKNALDAANLGAQGWSKMTPLNRSQIMCSIAENLSAMLVDSVSEDEINNAVTSLRFWARTDKTHGEVIVPNSTSTVLHFHEPLGVIAVILPDKNPLLSLAVVCGAALAFGSSVVLLPSPANSETVLKFCQVVEASSVPAGVINVVTGRIATLTGLLGQYGSLAGVWDFQGGYSGDVSSSGNNLLLSCTATQKSFWRLNGNLVDWKATGIEPCWTVFRHFATQNKRIWMSSLESFAN